MATSGSYAPNMISKWREGGREEGLKGMMEMKEREKETETVTTIEYHRECTGEVGIKKGERSANIL